nr:membrane protein insertion efficiency factor YidD [Microbulbifer sp. NKW57]
MVNIAQRAGLALIKVYRYLLSPWVGNQCRFYPTCSHYAEDAIKEYGFLKGGYLAALRLIKCHPWHPGGHDPVPEKKPQRPQHNDNH